VSSPPAADRASLPGTVSGAPRADPDTEQKHRDLQRMRRIATLLLVFMTAVFIATSLISWPWLGYVRAFAEAAMVGACADWFAVVALFRRPFGLPIPHTGIVPQNKDRIGAALGRFISANFLSPSVLARRLDKIDAVEFAADWLGHPGNARRIAEPASRLLTAALGAMPREPLVEWLATTALRGLEGVPAAPLASRILALVWARGETQALLDSGLDYAETSLIRHKDFIRATVAQKSSRFIPKWVDALLADRVISGLQSSLAEMRKPEHPWRLDIARAIETLIFDLADNPDMRARGEAMKREILANPAFVAQVREVCESLHGQASADFSAHAAVVADGLEFLALALGRWLREDAKIRARLNRWVRGAALRALSPRRAEIGGYIADVVEKWDATTFVDRLELQVGADLQYIRINGTLVGGLVGLVIFIASKWLPSP
jgi:uncharacterized membrane-anchored protein YjiN (DUF445 family)